MSELSTADYISHHLSFLKTGEGFSGIHIDSLFFSIVSGIVFIYFFHKAAKKATSGVPGKWQCFVEMLVEWVNGVVKDNFHGPRNVVAPLALTVFCWVFIMNSIDLIPVDFLPQLANLFGIHY